QDDSEIPPIEDIYQNSTDGIFTNSSYDDEGAVADFKNLETVVNVSPIPTSRIISSHPSALILGDLTSAVQTRSKVNKSSGAYLLLAMFKSKGEITIRTSSIIYLLVSYLKMNPRRFQKLLKMKVGLMLCDKYENIKNHKKTVKNEKHGHGKRKSTRNQRFKAKTKESQLQSTMGQLIRREIPKYSI
ncbi:hypothetical protein Tco_0192640, partial [Tanacetum coccineum]